MGVEGIDYIWWQSGQEDQKSLKNDDVNTRVGEGGFPKFTKNHVGVSKSRSRGLRTLSMDPNYYKFVMKKYWNVGYLNDFHAVKNRQPVKFILRSKIRQILREKLKPRTNPTSMRFIFWSIS